MDRIDIDRLPTSINRFDFVNKVANERIEEINSTPKTRPFAIINGSFLTPFTEEEYRDLNISAPNLQRVLNLHLIKHGRDTSLLCNQFDCSIETLERWLEGRASKNTRTAHKQKLHKVLGDIIFTNHKAFSGTY